LLGLRPLRTRMHGERACCAYLGRVFCVLFHRYPPPSAGLRAGPHTLTRLFDPPIILLSGLCLSWYEVFTFFSQQGSDCNKWRWSVSAKFYHLKSHGGGSNVSNSRGSWVGTGATLTKHSTTSRRTRDRFNGRSISSSLQQFHSPHGRRRSHACYNDGRSEGYRTTRKG